MMGDLSTKDIQLIVGKNRVLAGHECVCENFTFVDIAHEMDVVSVRSELVYEYEVKISRSDFLADKKKRKHKFNGIAEGSTLIPHFNPNYFSYVCPEGLISEQEIPSFAGLYYIVDNELVVIKKPKLYNKHKHDLAKIRAKVLRLYQQRHFLGGALLTYNNRLVQEKNRKIAPHLFEK